MLTAHWMSKRHHNNFIFIVRFSLLHSHMHTYENCLHSIEYEIVYCVKGFIHFSKRRIVDNPNIRWHLMCEPFDFVVVHTFCMPYLHTSPAIHLTCLLLAVTFPASISVSYLRFTSPLLIALFTSHKLLAREVCAIQKKTSLNFHWLLSIEWFIMTIQYMTNR